MSASAPSDAGTHFLDNAREQFTKLRAQAEAAMAQVDDPAFFRVPAPEANSIALVVKHIGGNALSRWTNFPTEDGEKPTRDRDQEFELAATADTRAALMARWAAGWRALDEALAPLTAADLLRTITIRNEPHTVTQALTRQLTHYAGHVGQIVLLCKLERGAAWRTLSVPRGQSAAFNARMEQKHRA